MIKVTGLTKRFGPVVALDNVSTEIKEGSVYGLVGTNGAGKSTFLRLVTGVLRPDSGVVEIDDIKLFDEKANSNSVEAKSRFSYIPDDQYFFSNATPADMMSFYNVIYKGFDTARFKELTEMFSLPGDRKISTFSKGMKKQLSIILGLSANTKYLFCDETFDGLDPVMRKAVKSLFASDMTERGLTIIVTSHNLRELEDFVDNIGLMHKGGILFSEQLEDMKLKLHKLQCVLKDGMGEEIYEGLDIIRIEKRGSIHLLTIRGDAPEIIHRMEQVSPLFYELIPLTLEEIFISETEVAGYDVKNLVL